MHARTRRKGAIVNSIFDKKDSSDQIWRSSRTTDQADKKMFATYRNSKDKGKVQSLNITQEAYELRIRV